MSPEFPEPVTHQTVSNQRLSLARKYLRRALSPRITYLQDGELYMAREAIKEMRENINCALSSLPKPPDEQE